MHIVVITICLCTRCLSDLSSTFECVCLPGGVGPMRSASAASSASCEGNARAIVVCSGGCVARQYVCITVVGISNVTRFGEEIESSKYTSKYSAMCSQASSS